MNKFRTKKILMKTQVKSSVL